MKTIASLIGLLIPFLNANLKIGVSKDADLFIDWLREAVPSVEVIDLYGLLEEQSKNTLIHCDGLILSGGPDIDPIRYGKPEKANLCYLDQHRDRREWILTDIAIEKNIPILGICRGFQLLNVFFGGTLITDIPLETTSQVIHRMDNDTAYHAIFITENTLLASLTPSNCVGVNSSHHQTVDRLAAPFIVSARSQDELIEAFEWDQKENHPFLLAVEWHPERMNCSFSKHIAQAFLDAAQFTTHESEKR
jgi:putative glutamine amidotransferase